MLRIGVVTSFDTARGIGTVRSDQGSMTAPAPVGEASSWEFHCTVIADGTREIEVGTPVAFDVRAGGPGRWEAFEVTPTD